MDLRQAATKDELEEHQMSYTEAGRGEPEEKLKEKDIWLERDDRTIK